jgi:hypothetical protein
MRLRVGYELQYHFPQATPVIMILNVHYTRVFDLEVVQSDTRSRRGYVYFD